MGLFDGFVPQGFADRGGMLGRLLSLRPDLAQGQQQDQPASTPQAPSLAPSLGQTSAPLPNAGDNIQPPQLAQAHSGVLQIDPFRITRPALPFPEDERASLGPALVGSGALLGLGLGALILNNQRKDAPANVPPLPDDLIGNNPQPGGNRSNTDLPGINPTPEELFDKLTGGRSETLPDGTRKGPNNVRLRPDVGDGPRLDIPANGKKPHETIHFPGKKS